jgi:hypothetical protein
MNAKNLQRTLLLLVLVGAPAVYFTYRQDSRWSQQSKASSASPRPGQSGNPALPSLRAANVAIKSIELQRGSDSSRLELGADGWTLPERENFPAAQEPVLDLLASLARLELLEPKTAKPENFEKLGLVAPADGGQSALSVRLLDAGGAEVGALLLGERAWDRGFPAVYVRRAGENQTYLAKGEVKGGAALRDYLPRDLVAWKTERAAAVEVRFPDQPEQDYRAARSGGSETNFALAAVPEGKQAASPYLVSGAARAVGSLRIEDVVQEGSPRQPDLGSAKRVQLAWESFDGLRLTLEGYELAAESEFGAKPLWARVRAELLDWAGAPKQDVLAPAPEAGDGGQGEANPTPAEPAGPTREELEREVQELNRRASGWLFRIESSGTAALVRGLSDLVQDPTPPAAAGFPGDAQGGLDLSGLDTSGLDLEQLGMSEADLQKALQQLGNQPPVEQPPAEQPPAEVPPPSDGATDGATGPPQTTPPPVTPPANPAPGTEPPASVPPTPASTPSAPPGS